MGNSDTLRHLTCLMSSEVAGRAMNTTIANAIPRTVDSPDAVFFFREIGGGPGTPLVFLNHLNGDLEDWDPAFVNGLATHHRIIIFDYRAVGESGFSAAVNIPDMALDAIKFIGALGLKLVDLVGFSIGAFVAQQIVHERPDLVRRVFLAGTVPAGEESIKFA